MFYFLREQGAAGARIHVMVEKRGKREDADLELEFRRVCDGGNYKAEQLPFEVAFVDKKSNSAGLQIADCRLQIADCRLQIWWRAPWA